MDGLTHVQQVNRIQAVPVGPVGTYSVVPPTLAFDSRSDLLWTGNDHGYISSFNGPDLHSYTSYRGHNSNVPTERVVRQLYFNDRGVISVAAKSLHMSNRGGIAQWNLLDARFQNLRCMAYTSRGQSEVLVAGEQDKMFTVNLERGSVAAEFPTDEEIKIMRRNNRFIVAGTGNGHVRLLDLTSYKVVKEFDNVHTGGILDMDTHENIVVTCGYTMRHGNYISDPLVKIYDVRMQKTLPPVSFPAAAFLRMHPKMSSVAIIASRTGQFQEIDLVNSTMKMRHANVQTYMTGMDLSPTGDALAFMDAEGFIHLWGTPGKMRFSELAMPLDMPEPLTKPGIAINDDSPLNMIGMPYYREELLSIWSPYPIYEVSMQPQRIDADILEIAKKSPYGYAHYHKRFPRNYVGEKRFVDNKGVVPAPKFLSQQVRDGPSRPPEVKEQEKLLFGDDSRRAFEVAPIYKKLEIKYSKFGVDDFDFVYFNKTKHSGLETNIPNSYMNPLLQLYRFIPVLRNIALLHTAGSCTLEECMLCQMGYLFDMLEKANGQNCQATNFLKTLSSLPNASRHGVLEEHSTSPGSLAIMMQRLNRFLLDQATHDQKAVWRKDEPDLPSAVTVSAVKTQRCTACLKESRPQGDTCATDLIYSTGGKKKPNNSSPPQSFSTVVRQSIEPELTQKGWCDKCRKYQNQITKKTVKRLPDILTFNTTLSDKNMGSAKQHFSTPEWLPDEIGLAITEKAGVSAWQGRELEARKDDKSINLNVYELVGLVMEVKGEEDRGTHLVSFVNVAIASSQRQLLPGEPDWHLFNDFLVKPVTKQEALDFTPNWKMPSLLCFQLKSERSVIKNNWRDRIDPWILYHDFTYFGKARREETVMPLSPNTEAPRKGTLVALDAEFVSMQNEETEVKADGTRSVVRPNRMGLARVSVLRGQGPDEGTPFLDDYIATREPVVDYLTEFSGIHPGDLNPETSKHAVVSLKVAYKRLWILLNLGCVFVGHGLLKDFRIINIHVPKEQVIDTVDLYALPGTQRKLSLRFLAWVILNDQIQQEEHDSIEDARTALRLYRKHEEFVGAGILDQTFNRIWEEGMKANWKAPVQAIAAAAWKAKTRLLEESSLPRSETSSPQPQPRMAA